MIGNGLKKVCWHVEFCCHTVLLNSCAFETRVYKENMATRMLSGRIFSTLRFVHTKSRIAIVEEPDNVIRVFKQPGILVILLSFDSLVLSEGRADDRDLQQKVQWLFSLYVWHSRANFLQGRFDSWAIYAFRRDCTAETIDRFALMFLWVPSFQDYAQSNNWKWSDASCKHIGAVYSLIELILISIWLVTSDLSAIGIMTETCIGCIWRSFQELGTMSSDTSPRRANLPSLPCIDRNSRTRVDLFVTDKYSLLLRSCLPCSVRWQSHPYLLAVWSCLCVCFSCRSCAF